MAKHTIVTMPGDGIGNQVLPESLRVLHAVGFDAQYVYADIGWDCWCAQGNALPDRTIDLLTQHKLGLFGAITSKPNKAAQAELKAENGNLYALAINNTGVVRATGTRNAGGHIFLTADGPVKPFLASVAAVIPA